VNALTTCGAWALGVAVVLLGGVALPTLARLIGA
jgi:hypothetical protein